MVTVFVLFVSKVKGDNSKETKTNPKAELKSWILTSNVNTKMALTSELKAQITSFCTNCTFKRVPALTHVHPLRVTSTVQILATNG